MDSVWTSLFSFLALYALAILSPGPNFFLVTGKALNHSRREGALTACGVATGSGIFAFAGLVGLLPLVNSLPYFNLVLRYAGGGYLVWVGVDMLRTCRQGVTQIGHVNNIVAASPFVPYRLGLITNLTNPKAWAFYLSLFALVMDSTLPVWSKLFLNATMFLISLAWYMTAAYLVSSRMFQPIFLNYKPLIQGLLGILVIVAGVKILWG